MLWIALYLPDLPLEVFLRGGDTSAPLAVGSGQGRPQVLLCNAAAAGLGVRPGMSVSAAQALAGTLRVRPRDSTAEAAALDNLAAWAVQFTSSVSLSPPQGLLLEVAGSLKLFGGMVKLSALIRQGLDEIGYRALCASAPTPLGAWLLARAGVEVRIVDATALARRLSALPLALLDQPPAVLETLDSLGVQTLGDCLRLPRDGLARRFGQALPDELDRALGKTPDPRKFFEAPAQFKSALELPADVRETEALLFAARRLALELEGFLNGRGGGVQQFVLDLLHQDLPATRLSIGLLAPSRDNRHWLTLLRERLARTELPAPVRALCLAAEEILPLRSYNLSLFPDAAQQQESWNGFVERLRARLGADAVQGICAASEHRPELAWRACEPGREYARPAPATRPLWLLAEPRRLAMAGGEPCLDGPLALKQGPERIETGWWDGQRVTRDYYVAESAAGARFWVFRERLGEWYLHGVVG